MKKFINKILDVPKLIRRIWIILWLILIILLILKFCFGMWYPIISNNEVFNNICNFIDNRRWLYAIISSILYILNLNFLSLTNMGQRKYKNWLWLLIINIFIVTSSILKIFNSTIGNIFEIIFLFTAFSIINVKCINFKKLWQNILIPIIVYATINLWQLSIFLVRGLNLNELQNYEILIPLILQLDYYIFIIILWIGVSYMGWFGAGWLWSKDITVLKAEKEKELAKENPDTKLIKKIDERIAELEKEGK